MYHCMLRDEMRCIWRSAAVCSRAEAGHRRLARFGTRDRACSCTHRLARGGRRSSSAGSVQSAWVAGCSQRSFRARATRTGHGALARATARWHRPLTFRAMVSQNRCSSRLVVLRREGEPGQAGRCLLRSGVRNAPHPSLLPGHTFISLGSLAHWPVF